ncbi:WD repeat-containing protein [Salix suchowensis]|nr:WD repeat-containing protein [Salix suchowensis]
MDHQCDKDAFPRTTTTILQVHDDEVWNLEWSHDGQYLASGSKDKTAIIWKVGVRRAREVVFVLLRKNLSSFASSACFFASPSGMEPAPYIAGAPICGWVPSVVSGRLHPSHKCRTNHQSMEHKGVCFQTIDGHSDVVTALAWLPDDSGFISGSLDRKVIRWDREGRQRDSWGTTAIRVTDLAVTPDFTRLVTIGMDYVPPHSVTVIDANPRVSLAGSYGGEAPMGTPQSVPKKPDNRMVIYDLATKQAESCVIGFPSAGVSPSQPYNHQFHTEIHLWDLHTGRLTRKFTGQRQGRHVIRSCFGGVDGNFVTGMSMYGTETQERCSRYFPATEKEASILLRGTQKPANVRLMLRRQDDPHMGGERA